MTGVAHLLAVAALLLSFALLHRPQIRVYAAQGWLVAAVAAWQGWLLGEPGLVAVAVVGGLVRGLALPALLRRLPAAADPARRGPVLGGLAVVALAAMLARSVPGVTREDLAVALAVLGLGILIMVTRRGPGGETLGFLSFEAGIALLAVTVDSPASLTLAGLALAAGVSLAAIRRRDAAS